MPNSKYFEVINHFSENRKRFMGLAEQAEFTCDNLISEIRNYFLFQDSFAKASKPTEITEDSFKVILTLTFKYNLKTKQTSGFSVSRSYEITFFSNSSIKFKEQTFNNITAFLDFVYQDLISDKSF